MRLIAIRLTASSVLSCVAFVAAAAGAVAGTAREARTLGDQDIRARCQRP